MADSARMSEEDITLPSVAPKPETPGVVTRSMRTRSQRKTANAGKNKAETTKSATNTEEATKTSSEASDSVGSKRTQSKPKPARSVFKRSRSGQNCSGKKCVWQKLPLEARIRDLQRRWVCWTPQVGDVIAGQTDGWYLCRVLEVKAVPLSTETLCPRESGNDSLIEKDMAAAASQQFFLRVDWLGFNTRPTWVSKEKASILPPVLPLLQLRDQVLAALEAYENASQSKNKEERKKLASSLRRARNLCKTELSSLLTEEEQRVCLGAPRPFAVVELFETPCLESNIDVARSTEGYSAGLSWYPNTQWDALFKQALRLVKLKRGGLNGKNRSARRSVPKAEGTETQESEQSEMARTATPSPRELTPEERQIEKGDLTEAFEFCSTKLLHYSMDEVLDLWTRKRKEDEGMLGNSAAWVFGDVLNQCPDYADECEEKSPPRTIDLPPPPFSVVQHVGKMLRDLAAHAWRHGCSVLTATDYELLLRILPHVEEARKQPSRQQADQSAGAKSTERTDSTDGSTSGTTRDTSSVEFEYEDAKESAPSPALTEIPVGFTEKRPVPRHMSQLLTFRHLMRLIALLPRLYRKGELRISILASYAIDAALCDLIRFMERELNGCSIEMQLDACLRVKPGQAVTDWLINPSRRDVRKDGTSRCQSLFRALMLRAFGPLPGSRAVKRTSAAKLARLMDDAPEFRQESADRLENAQDDANHDWHSQPAQVAGASADDQNSTVQTIASSGVDSEAINTVGAAATHDAAAGTSELD
ncbi:MAG: hypothetical protein MHM6MM_002893 [Cercozoa sp. M6MM]